MGEVLSIGTWRTNAEMIADVAKLPGYLAPEAGKPEWSILDATYGKHGGFWKDWKPEDLTTSDLYHPADLAWDYRAMPCDDCSFDVVVFDPPYKLNGTPAMGEMDERFGTTRRTTRDEVMADIRAGAVECYRVARRRLFVKCMDQVESGQMRWQTDMVTEAIAELGGRKMDRFDAPTAGIQQPTDRKCPNGCDHGTDRATLTTCNSCEGIGRLPIVQRTSRGKHSTLLVFAKPARARTAEPTLL